MKNLKDEAVRLRKQGKSYNEINRSLKVPKSTLASWFKNHLISKHIKHQNISSAKKIWAENIRQFNFERAKQARLKAFSIESDAEKEISPLNKDKLKIIGAALYWAEGYNRAKWNALFCNSDPAMVKLMMKFFREICKVPEDQFRPQVQIHPNISMEAAENYWSSITGLEKKQFLKPLMQISKSSKRKRPPHRLPFGTFRVGIANAKVLYQIKGWIKGLRTLYATLRFA